jgi:hypothetical protein
MPKEQGVSSWKSKHDPSISAGEKTVQKLQKRQCSNDQSLFTPTPDGHYPHVDATRIAAVWCVAIDHGAPSFGIVNALFTQNWVLQYLFLVSGVSFGLSNRSSLGYVARLGVYFAIGVVVNVSAHILTGQPWWNHMFAVVFQFWFVAALMVYIMLLTPLKRHLANVKAQGQMQASEDDANPEVTSRPADKGVGAWLLMKAVLVVIIGFLSISVVFVCLAEPIANALAPIISYAAQYMGTNAASWMGGSGGLVAAQHVIVEMMLCLQLTLTCIFVVLVYPYFAGETTLVGWLLLVITYTHRIVFFRGQQERPLHCFDLTMLGLVCYFYGLRNRQVVADVLARYWMVVLFGCAMLWPPGEYANAHHRFDEQPIDRLDERARWNALEGIFVMIWLVAGERLIDPTIFTQDKLGFLNEWALLVFLLHKAIHIAVIEPLNWLLLLALAPLCWYVSTR